MSIIEKFMIWPVVVVVVVDERKSPQLDATCEQVELQSFPWAHSFAPHGILLLVRNNDLRPLTFSEYYKCH